MEDLGEFTFSRLTKRLVSQRRPREDVDCREGRVSRSGTCSLLYCTHQTPDTRHQVPAVILPFLHTTPATDALFCTLAVLHSHWGIEAIVVDYIR